jgi:hypothetical protein
LRWAAGLGGGGVGCGTGSGGKAAKETEEKVVLAAVQEDVLSDSKEVEGKRGGGAVVL